MEDRSVGISIKNVPVRLNDENIESETIGELKRNLFCNASSDTNAPSSHLTKACEASQKISPFDVPSERSSSDLHLGASGLLNGCSEILHNDLNGLHISVNGVDSYELLDDVNRVICGRPEEYARTKPSYPNSEISLSKESCQKKSKESCLSGQDASPGSDQPTSAENASCADECDISYVGYDSEHQMPDIIRLIQKDLSEPYSIYTYRYFIHNWPKLCFLALHKDECVGAIVCKLDVHKKHSRRGYIAMLAVDEKYRKRKIGSNLVLKAIDAMAEDNADEVVLETEITNKPALKLYENLGFVRDKRLFRYYLNGVDALRLKLWLR